MIATNKNQSKKLIELCLSVDTADMYYVEYDNNTYLTSMDKEYDKCTDTPAWSLSALIELMPIKIGNSMELNIYKGESGYSLTYYSCDENPPIIKDSVTLLDAAFEMMCYLLENKLIKF